MQRRAKIYVGYFNGRGSSEPWLTPATRQKQSLTRGHKLDIQQVIENPFFGRRAKTVADTLPRSRNLTDDVGVPSNVWLVTKPSRGH